MLKINIGDYVSIKYMFDRIGRVVKYYTIEEWAVYMKVPNQHYTPKVDVIEIEWLPNTAYSAKKVIDYNRYWWIDSVVKVEHNMEYTNITPRFVS